MKNLIQLNSKLSYQIQNWYLKEGLSLNKISKKINISTGTISKHLKNVGIKIVNRQNQHLWTDEDLIKDFNNGLSNNQIVKKYKMDKGVLIRHLAKYNCSAINLHNQVKFNQNVFDCIDTEEKAYWLGFIFADGYISSHIPDKKKTYKFELSLSLKDKSHLEKFNQFMRYNGNNVKSDSFRCRWSVSNKHLWETLNSYGCTPRKSLTLKFPDESIFKDKSLIRHFIRGYFDGDGCITWSDKNQKKWCISILGTENILQKIQFYISFTNNRLFLNDPKNNITKVLQYFGSSAKTVLLWIYFDSNVYLDRKYTRFLQFPNCRLRQKCLRWLSSKIGEGWDANTELTSLIAKGKEVV